MNFSGIDLSLQNYIRIMASANIIDKKFTFIYKSKIYIDNFT